VEPAGTDATSERLRHDVDAATDQQGIFHERTWTMSTEISTSVSPARGLALATFDDAFRFAEMVAKSDFAPKDFRNKPESCLLAIQHGAELGLSPMQSLQSIAVINGRPSIWGDAALAVVSASAVCEYVTEEIEDGKDGEALVATCIAKRRGYPKPTVVRFTVADAKRAGLWGKGGPWTQYPRRMLQLRARGFALRDAFPDVLRGLVTAEEAQDYQHDTHESSRPVIKSVSTSGGITVAHVERFEPASESATATPGDMEKSRIAVNRATRAAELERYQAVTEERLRSGFYSPAQADELLALINGKIDLLTTNEEAVA
jgi:hypothetical protein